MQLDAQWKDIAKRGWSMRFMYLAAAFGVLQAALPYLLDGFEIPPTWAGLITMTIVAGGMWSRLIYQRGLGQKKGEPIANDESYWT